MRTIPSSIAPEVFDGFTRGDRDALRQLFEEYAPSLAESADSEVHIDVAAAHIVEHLFERAWQERRDFTSPETLHDWLVSETHALSVREQVRRASLRRFDAREQVLHASTATPLVSYDVAAGWSRLQHRIEQLDVDPTEAAAQRFEVTRHDAAEHIAHVGEGISQKVIVGGVVLLLAVASILYWGMERAGAGFKVTRALADKEAHAITTTVGERARVKLEDGTQVTMGADDSLIVPKAFNQAFRAVKLLGAARFEVASNPKLPFEVRAGNLQIVATGTTFTISAYANDAVIVTVQEGAVQVTLGKDVRELSKGAALMLTGDSTLAVPTPAQMQEATAWVDGTFVIADRELRSTLPMFRRWYRMDLRPEVKLLERRVSMTVPLDSTDVAIRALERAAHVKQIWVKQAMVLVDAPEVPSPATTTKASKARK